MMALNLMISMGLKIPGHIAWPPTTFYIELWTVKCDKALYWNGKIRKCYHSPAIFSIAQMKAILGQLKKYTATVKRREKKMNRNLGLINLPTLFLRWLLFKIIANSFALVTMKQYSLLIIRYIILSLLFVMFFFIFFFFFCVFFRSFIRIIHATSYQHNWYWPLPVPLSNNII